MEHTPARVDFTILFNASAAPKDDPPGCGTWRKEIIAAIKNTTQWPNTDVFDKYP